MVWGGMLMSALDLAVEAHRGTFRDGESAVPYACHPVEVMLLLRHEAGVLDEAHLAAALLHDTVEDTSVTLELVSERFGSRVAELVGEVTRDEPSDEETAGMSKDEIWELRTGMLMEEIGRMSGEARMIKLADRLSNIRESKRTRSGKKLDRYVRQTRMILEAIPREVCPRLWDLVSAEV